MRVDVYFTASSVDQARIHDGTAVVIDVLRATSCVVEALANGARAVYPASEPEDALRLISSLGREDTLLCGERQGRMIEGFDLGNSPAEFSAERVGGKRLVMSTTNGTRALLTVMGAPSVLAASFLNLGAVVNALGGEDDAILVCAGRQGRFALEDALCAGRILAALESRREEGLSLNDAGRAARVLADAHEISAEVLRTTAGGQALVEIGLAEDLVLCAEVDRRAIVPEMKDRVIQASPTPS
ncbi:MAG TPA: 2-phosphosulfolactate phosphatase [Longimicrobiales bacterium]|jgi:2-phosphosulfolactate phosphatase